MVEESHSLPEATVLEVNLFGGLGIKTTHLVYYPIASMYGIFTYIYHKNQSNVCNIYHT